MPTNYRATMDDVRKNKGDHILKECDHGLDPRIPCGDCQKAYEAEQPAQDEQAHCPDCEGKIGLIPAAQDGGDNADMITTYIRSRSWLVHGGVSSDIRTAMEYALAHQQKEIEQLRGELAEAKAEYSRTYAKLLCDHNRLHQKERDALTAERDAMSKALCQTSKDCGVMLGWMKQKAWDMDAAVQYLYLIRDMVRQALAKGGEG